MKNRAALAACALLLSGLAAGCSDSEDFAEECKELGGTVETDREKKTRTIKVNGKKRTETYNAYDQDCVDDEGNEILDD